MITIIIIIHHRDIFEIPFFFGLFLFILYIINVYTLIASCYNESLTIFNHDNVESFERWLINICLIEMTIKKNVAFNSRIMICMDVNDVRVCVSHLSIHWKNCLWMKIMIKKRIWIHKTWPRVDEKSQQRYKWI